MRIVGGSLSGRKLAQPKLPKTGVSLIRPTTDRVRESLFNILEHRIDLEGRRVIDLFAGTGALGLEAMSRGAAFCLFVDHSAEGRALIRQNVEALGLGGRAKIFRRDAKKLGTRGTFKPFDLVFADPPYGKGLGEAAIASLFDDDWLSPDCLIVLEEARQSAPGELANCQLLDQREFGDTTIGLFERV